ncbi:MAG: hypothetical protein KJZ83_03500 [Burkholderiaceae bacterium]|nr:hypothetical protein [Burkholderiaceae bacterium]
MNRRQLMQALAAIPAGAVVPAAFAHHGWSSFNPSAPLFTEGRVRAVRWRNPHAEVDIEVAAELRLPADLAARSVPAQTAGIDAAALLAIVKLPARKDRVWTIELAPLTRMQAWQVAPLTQGEMIQVVGYTLTDQSEPVIRAEWLFRAGKVYGLRSSPA